MFKVGSRLRYKVIIHSILELNQGGVMFIFYKFHSGIEPLLFHLFPHKTDYFDLKWVRDHPVPLYREDRLAGLFFRFRYFFPLREFDFKSGSHNNSKPPKGVSCTLFRKPFYSGM